ncbi:chloride channel [Penicillium ochrochloron]
MSMTGQSSGSDDQPYATSPALPEQERENPRLQDTSRGAEGFEPLSSLFSTTAGGSNTPGLGFSRPHGGQNGDASPLEPYGPVGLNGDPNSKDGGPLDWYVEGPGRRVGYDDFTAIDWIYEYTKERQRKRLLYSSGQGVFGYVRRVIEASNVWFVLIATGIAVGILAAAIDIATDWLGDLKTGYCKSGSGGGKFYLNRSFCCWGLNGKSTLGVPWR